MKETQTRTLPGWLCGRSVSGGIN